MGNRGNKNKTTPSSFIAGGYEEGDLIYEEDTLSPDEELNDYVHTQLATMTYSAINVGDNLSKEEILDQMEETGAEYEYTQEEGWERYKEYFTNPQRMETAFQIFLDNNIISDNGDGTYHWNVESYEQPEYEFNGHIRSSIDWADKQ